MAGKSWVNSRALRLISWCSAMRRDRCSAELLTVVGPETAGFSQNAIMLNANARQRINTLVLFQPLFAMMILLKSFFLTDGTVTLLGSVIDKDSRSPRLRPSRDAL